jgi:Rieske Fe-S protein
MTDERDGRPGQRPPRWREDFPVRWEEAHLLTRRELAKFLTLGSGLILGANLGLVALARRGRPGPFPEVKVAVASAVTPGGSVLFRYPTADDPCILIRTNAGVLKAYSQMCTHLSCAVVHRPAEDALVCPCHHGRFAAADGRPTLGPPRRRLPRITLDVRGDDVYAVGVDA